jgi:hypothetical protein
LFRLYRKANSHCPQVVLIILKEKEGLENIRSLINSWSKEEKHKEYVCSSGT